ncbi:hypothetical protein [Actinoallomurus sp. CA-142502]|uniref:hypothetical protein n=1 Tax=Actinoallomurus sp. CA-142502 TaxID=3239885 RepID=UPI003D91C79C
MKVFFCSTDLARRCADEATSERTYGRALASVLHRRLGEMVAATHLAMLRRIPAARLRSDPAQEGGLLVALGEGADLRVQLRSGLVPLLLDGSLDEQKVTELLVTEVAVA